MWTGKVLDIHSHAAPVWDTASVLNRCHVNECKCKQLQSRLPSALSKASLSSSGCVIVPCWLRQCGLSVKVLSCGWHERSAAAVLVLWRNAGEAQSVFEQVDACSQRLPEITVSTCSLCFIGFLSLLSFTTPLCLTHAALISHINVFQLLAKTTYLISFKVLINKT